MRDTYLRISVIDKEDGQPQTEREGHVFIILSPYTTASAEEFLQIHLKSAIKYLKIPELPI